MHALPVRLTQALPHAPPPPPTQLDLFRRKEDAPEFYELYALPAAAYVAGWVRHPDTTPHTTGLHGSRSHARPAYALCACVSGSYGLCEASGVGGPELTGLTVRVRDPPEYTADPIG
jgi:hypothetical protein